VNQQLQIIRRSVSRCSVSSESTISHQLVLGQLVLGQPLNSDFRFSKAEPNVMLVKHSYGDDFARVDLMRMSRKPSSAADVQLRISGPNCRRQNTKI